MKKSLIQLPFLVTIIIVGITPIAISPSFSSSSLSELGSELGNIFGDQDRNVDDGGSDNDDDGDKDTELSPTPVPRQPQAQEPVTSHDTQAQVTTNNSNTRNINLLSSSSYIDSIGYLHVVGELQNTSPEPREFVEIVATLRDPSGNILDSSSTYSDVEVEFLVRNLHYLHYLHH